ncbi:MAG: hypothetical protein RBT11_04890 [Desulfobacterales bacterium]|nr:hypothetical protein [Desulfobacterales bacterium]
MCFSAFEILYHGIAGSFIISGTAALFQKKWAGLCFGFLATALSVFGVGLIILEAGRPPLFGHYEIITQSVFIISLLALLEQRSWHRHRLRFLSPVTTRLWLLCAFLMCVLYFFPKTVNADFYMYSRIAVMTFFNFRISAGAFFLVAAIHFYSGFFQGGTDLPPSAFLHKGRNFLLIGTICFLISECSGSYWCLIWWGDTWHWSKGFLKAASLFMLVMLSFHVPGKWKLPKAFHWVICCMPGMGSLWLLLMH